MNSNDQERDEAILRAISKRPWNTPQVIETALGSTEKVITPNEFNSGNDYGPS